MADQAGDKTQDPTPHRRQQAREQGQVAFSQDLGSAAILVAGASLLLFFGKGLAEASAQMMTRQLSSVGPLPTDPSHLAGQWQQLFHLMGGKLIPILGLLFVAAALASIMQVGFLFVPQRLAPDLGRLSPLAGIKRIVSLQGAMRLSFGMFKVLLVTVTSAIVLYLYRREVLYAADMPGRDLAVFLPMLMLKTALWVGAALLILALLDFAFQRWKHEQELRMTHQEVREEMKNLQGDPQIVARRRAIQRQMALNRIGEKVPQADFVVTNPTELAVAVQYEPTTMAAPVVVAKGAGVLAQRIRKLALEHNIPVIERKPLAQLLYKNVDVGRPVPDDSYAAVAEVLAYVYQLKGKKFEMPGT
ncbi:flagellar type III secretion system protein FlhB [Pirellulales bacterium]|nr:flagellar type III secretion system protein FlhB [Pirellulales bacterium]